MNNTNKSTPEVEATKDATAIKVSKRTGKPVRKYAKTGASAMIKQGISPRTGKPIRSYKKTGAAALIKKGISPRTGKPIRKYNKNGTTVEEAIKDQPAKVKSEKVSSTTAYTQSTPKTTTAPAKKASRKTKVVREVVAE